MTKKLTREEIYAEAVELRRKFHENPELSLEEYETSDFILHYLQQESIPARKAGTGVIGDIFVGADLPTLALRAEMDALPIQERSVAPYLSKRPGVSHACGHDGITAVLLVLAKLLNRSRERLSCNLRLIFEPGEEIGKGAKLMIEAGAMEGVEKVIIFHFANSLPLGMEVQQGFSTATVGRIAIEIRGKSTHWGDRALGVDAICAAGEALREIEELNRNFSTELPFVAGIGKMSGGVKNNIMADSALLEGTLRAFGDDAFDELFCVLQQRLEAVAERTGAEMKLILESRMPAVVNDSSLVDLAMRAGRAHFGKDCVLGVTPYLAGDNAAYYFQLAKGVRMVFFGEKADCENFPIHNPGFDFDEEILGHSIDVLSKMVFSMTA